MDARFEAFRDQHDAKTVDNIRSHGWHIEYVMGDLCVDAECTTCDRQGFPAFAYTIGLFGLGHPELLVFGLPPDSAAWLLNLTGQSIRSGAALLPGIAFDAGGKPIVPEVVPNPGEVALGANRFYERPPEASVPVLQLAHPDEQGRYPWEEGCSVAHLQPRPGSFAA